MRELLVTALAAYSLAAQVAQKAPAFEVASIKPAAPDARGMGMTTLPGGRVSMKNVTLRLLIEMAWDIRDHQLLGAQGWLDTEHFDIVAKPEMEIPRTPEGRALQTRMIQTLVEERFGLVFHNETKEMPIYALVVSKNGPKLATSAPDTKGSSMMGRGRLDCKYTKTNVLAKMLGGLLGRTVVDQTGLTGDYDFTMQWVPDMGESMGPKGLPEGPPKEAPQPADGPSLFTAIQEQLGLKLESQKGPVEMFVIDRATRPSEN